MIRTITKTLSQENDEMSFVQNAPLELIITLPVDMESIKIPISISICYGKTKEHNKKINGKLECYHYALPNHRKEKKEVLDMPLIDTNNDWIREVTRNIAILTCRKYNKPCYVTWSSMKPTTEQITMDQLFILGKCMNLITSSIEE